VNILQKSLATRDYKLIAKIGLSVGMSGLIGVLFVLWLIGDRDANGYGEIIDAVGSLKRSLAPAIWLFGLIMVSAAGLMTWLFALYASFRTAGPLFRIARDIEDQIQQGSVKPIPIRANDKLQAEWIQFETGVARLRTQCIDIGLALNPIQLWLDDPHSGDDQSSFRPLLKNLIEVEQRVKL
jgi:hypothetical protein